MTPFILNSFSVLFRHVRSHYSDMNFKCGMHGLEESRRQVEKLSAEAVEILASFPRRNLFLEELVRQLIYRQK